MLEVALMFITRKKMRLFSQNNSCTIYKKLASL